MTSSTTLPARHTRRAVLPVAATLATASLILAGCSGGSSASDSASGATSWPTGQTIVVSFIAPAPAEKPALDYLKATFESEFPGNTLKLENRTWADRLAVYEKTVVDGDGTVPDVIEMGNTDTPTFSAQGALTDLTAKADDLGADDFLQGLVASGTYDGKFYAPPLYAGARLVWYDASAVSLEKPATLADYVTQGVSLRKAEYSGIFMPGQDWHDGLAFVDTNGGYVAEQQADGSWKAGFSTAGGIAGLKQFQQVFQKANSSKVAPADTNESVSHKKPQGGANQFEFCQGKVGYLPADVSMGGALRSDPGTVDDPSTVCPNGSAQNLKAFAMPGLTTGDVAKTFGGGSNIGIPAKSQHQVLAYQALKIVASSGFQDVLALQGTIPGRISSASNLPQDVVTLEAAKSAQNAVATPASPNWGTVESRGVLDAAFQKVAEGGDVATIAKSLDAQIEKILNAPVAKSD